MIFSLDVQRARKGDCLLMHYGTSDDPGLALIDGGPAKVYGPHLQPRLKQIRQARGLDDDESLSIDWLMVSHIDDDHINGILELTKELVEAKDEGRPSPFKIRSFWHNTFDDIIGNSSHELLAAVTASFGTASLSGEPDIEGADPHAARVLASVRQGIRLRDDTRKLNVRTNPPFDGKPAIATQDGKSIDVGRELTFTFAGPMEKELVALQKKHDAFLKEQKEKRETEAALASFTDTSVANLSSLVVLAEFQKKRILFTGDARGDKILEGLEFAGVLKNDTPLSVDILKMPHHGSDRNIDPVFFQRITADHYVFSGDGEHGNPERNTLQMLYDERGDEEFTIHLTYPIEKIDEKRKEDWEREQEKEKKRKIKNSEVEVRADWSPKEHSLTSFFEDHQKLAKKVKIVEKGKPHVIDLLDEVGF